MKCQGPLVLLRIIVVTNNQMYRTIQNTNKERYFSTGDLLIDLLLYFSMVKFWKAIKSCKILRLVKAIHDGKPTWYLLCIKKWF